MKVVINGEQRDIPDGLNLLTLLQHLELTVDRVAVERNYEISKRTDWEKTPIQEGDQLEIVHFVGGGLGSGRTDGWRDGAVGGGNQWQHPQNSNPTSFINS